MQSAVSTHSLNEARALGSKQASTTGLSRSSSRSWGSIPKTPDRSSRNWPQKEETSACAPRSILGTHRKGKRASSRPHLTVSMARTWASGGSSASSGERSAGLGKIVAKEAGDGLHHQAQEW